MEKIAQNYYFAAEHDSCKEAGILTSLALITTHSLSMKKKKRKTQKQEVDLKKGHMTINVLFIKQRVCQ